MFSIQFQLNTFILSFVLSILLSSVWCMPDYSIIKETICINGVCRERTCINGVCNVNGTLTKNVGNSDTDDLFPSGFGELSPGRLPIQGNGINPNGGTRTNILSTKRTEQNSGARSNDGVNPKSEVELI